jgi:hypothetical protein
MSNGEKKQGLVLRKTTLRVLNDNELLWVAGAGYAEGEEPSLPDPLEGLSNVYTTRTTTTRGNTIPTRHWQPTDRPPETMQE